MATASCNVATRRRLVLRGRRVHSRDPAYPCVACLPRTPLLVLVLATRTPPCMSACTEERSARRSTSRSCVCSRASPTRATTLQVLGDQFTIQHQHAIARGVASGSCVAQPLLKRAIKPSHSKNLHAGGRQPREPVTPVIG